MGGAGLTRPGVAQAQEARLRALHALTLAALGRIDDAAGAACKALASAEAAGDRFAAGYALHALALVANRRLSPISSLDHIERALAVIRDDPQTAHLPLVLLSDQAGAPYQIGRPAQALTAAPHALD